MCDKPSLYKGGIRAGPFGSCSGFFVSQPTDESTPAGAGPTGPGPSPLPPPRPERVPLAVALQGHARFLQRVRSRQRRRLWVLGALVGATAALALLLVGGFAAQGSITVGAVFVALGPVAL